MPATQVDTFTCRHCCQERNINLCSPVVQRCCVHCFDEHYVLCDRCARTVRRTSFGTSRYDARIIRGEHLCSNCSFRSDRRGRDDYWRPTPMSVNVPTYTEIESTRKFGVEVETASCGNYRDLQDVTLFGAKDDCTVRGREFDSPVLYGDEGLKEIRDLLAFGEENSWSADGRCGCHTHYDMRGQTDIQMARIVYAYRVAQELIKALVHPDRHYTDYCSAPDYAADDVIDAYRGHCTRPFRRWLDYNERYEYLNTQALGDHNTFELRILEGTVDAELICNWVKFNARFMDWASGKSFTTLNRILSQPMDRVVRSVGRVTKMRVWLENRRAECRLMR